MKYLSKIILALSLAAPAGFALARGDHGMKDKSASSWDTPSLSTGQIREAQRALNREGFNVSTDGIVGSSTQKAIRDFQADNGLTKTGKLDVATLKKLDVSFAETLERSPASVREPRNQGTDRNMDSGSGTDMDSGTDTNTDTDMDSTDSNY